MIAKQNPCWMPGTTKCVEFVLNKDMVVFEWGSGASTQWLADRVKFIYSVEHQRKWFETTSQYLAGHNNFNLALKQFNPINDYVNTINEVGGKFDLIVIDGRHRVECFTEALKHIKLNGYLLFDDIERIRYSSAKEALSELPSLYFAGSLHKNCKFDDDPSGFTRQITGFYHYNKELFVKGY